MQFRNGFTLAEVLITLGIIGIVAAMTIPTLIANTRSSQYRSRLKKQYHLYLMPHAYQILYTVSIMPELISRVVPIQLRNILIL